MTECASLYLLLLLIIFSIATYQFWSVLDVLSFDTRPLPREYSSVSRTQDFGAPPDAALSTTPKLRRSIPRFVTSKMRKWKNARDLCDVPTDLGPIPVNTSDISQADVEKKFPMVKRGGRYYPPDCTARHKVAIIVPYRDRKKNLATFLNHMHPFLIKQKLEYGIFIVEQNGTHEFNRGKLMNVGFTVARGWQCYIFHDIDLLPLDERNIYSCPDPRYPRMLDSVAGMDKDAFSVMARGNFGGVSALTEEQFSKVNGNSNGYWGWSGEENDSFYSVMARGNFGGVSALTEEQFSKVNGYSNGYWGWSGEDNDLFYRLSHYGYITTQYNLSIARYATLHHKQKLRNPRRYRLLLQTMKPYQMDGLSNLQYVLVSTTRHRLYTHIVVNIDHTHHELQELFQEADNLKFKALPHNI